MILVDLLWRRRTDFSALGRVVAVALFALASCAAAASLSDVRAADRPTVSVQGSTTFNSRILKPNLAAIEQESGVTLNVVPNKTIWGLIALFEKRADLAMMSADLNGEVTQAKATAPGLAFDKLKQYVVAQVDVAFITHPSNPVTALRREQLIKILKGEITNWSEVDGKDMPIRVVATQNGGGTVMALRSQLLDGGKITAEQPAVIESAWQVVKAVEQLPGGIGVAQSGLAKKANVKIVDTGSAVQQTLTYITVGEPEPKVKAVIEATQKIIAANPL